MPEINDNPFDHVMPASPMAPVTPSSVVALDPETEYVYPAELEPAHSFWVNVSAWPSELLHSPDISLHPWQTKKTIHVDTVISDLCQ